MSEIKKLKPGANVTLSDDPVTGSITISAPETVIGTDPRLSDARSPVAHATSHKAYGSDSIRLDDLSDPADNTKLDATSDRHGLLLKLENTGTKFLRDDGTWQEVYVVGESRVTISWTLDAVAAVEEIETIMTVTESRDGADATTHGSYTITSGKRFRIQYLNWSVSNTTGSTIGENYLRVRVNTAGAADNTSPLQFSTALTTTAESNVLVSSGPITFPDGLEFAGDGTTQIAISWLSPQWVTGSVVCSMSMSLIGFEY